MTTLAESLVGSTFVTTSSRDGYVQIIVVEQALDDDAVLFRIIVCSYEPNIGRKDWALAANLLDESRWQRFEPPVSGL